MNLLVDGQFVGPMESLVTEIALEGLFSRVNEFVTGNFVASSKTTAALVALVRLLDLQTLLEDKCLMLA